MKNIFFDDLNKDQLDGLAELSFSLAKVVFAFILLPANNIFNNINFEIISKIITTIMGLAFTVLALVILKLKEKVKK